MIIMVETTFVCAHPTVTVLRSRGKWLPSTDCQHGVPLSRISACYRIHQLANTPERAPRISNECLNPVRIISEPSSSWELQTVRDAHVYIKRDDLLEIIPGVSGNKARKLYSLEKKFRNLYESSSVPDDLQVVSYGGTQSNAMLAAAHLTSHFHIPFKYYVKPVPKRLMGNPVGNLRKALDLGMEIVQISSEKYKAYFCDQAARNRFVQSLPENSLFFPQGLASSVSREGCQMLAQEIVDFVNHNEVLSSAAGLRPIDFVIASGTGTMAYFVAEALCLMNVPWIRVIAVPVVGDSQYLKDQWIDMRLQNDFWDGLDPESVMALKSVADGSSLDNVGFLESDTKIPFAQPHADLYRVYSDLANNNGLHVDLLYGARAWQTLLEKHPLFQDLMHKEVSGIKFKDPARVLLYYHCGGLEANESQLQRYRYKDLI